MKCRFFSNIHDLSELRKEYIKASKLYHPDAGGNEEDMKALNNAYEDAQERLKNEKVYTTWNGEHDEAKYQGGIQFQEEVDAKIREVMGYVIKYNLRIEVIGYWIYIHETTRERDREQMNGFNLKWAGKKKCWYFNPNTEYKRRGKKNYSLEEIRGMHGSSFVHTSNPSRQLPAH